MANEERVDYSQDLEQIQTFNAKCPNCGSAMVFDPETQGLKCEHCGSTSTIEKNFAEIENDITKGFAEAEKWSADEQVTYKCQNCGAVVVLSSDEEASICPFCQTTHVAKEGTFDGIRPHMVIPFQLGAEVASQKAKKWAKGRLFAPRKFKKNISIDKIKGVYEPCFTFDSNTFSTYQGKVGDRRTRTVGSGKNRRTETYVVYRNVRGSHAYFFNDVMVATNENFKQNDLNSLAPFDTKEACVYEKKYLSGYMADGNQVNLDDSWADAKVIMNGAIRQQIINKLHCDVVSYLNVSTGHSDVTFKYLLLPIYTLAYRFKKKNYLLRVNGSTGKVRGKTPVSPLRVAIASILGVALAVLLVWFFMNF